MSRLLSFPHEILDRIIDTVAEDISDRPTLWVCAQVAHVFTQRAYHHLFSFTRLRLSNTLERNAQILQRFLQLLRDSLQFTGIVNHIRHFYLAKDDFTSPAPDGHTLAAIFKLLDDTGRLDALSLDLHTSFLDLGEECLESLILLCRSPNFDTLTLRGLSNIPIYLLSGSRIKHIDLRCSTFLPYSSDRPKIVYQPESITIDPSELYSVLNAFHAGGGAIDRSTRYKEALAFLKELKLNVSNGLGSLPSCLDAAAFARDSLEAIDLRISRFWITFSTTPACSFHCFSNLRILRLGVCSYYSECPLRLEQFNIKLFRELLEVSTLPPSLEKLCLAMESVLFVPFVTGCPLVILEPNDPDWDLLDATLTGSTLCNIPIVSLTFDLWAFVRGTGRYCQHDDANTSTLMLAHARASLPRFAAARPDKLVVKTRVWVPVQRPSLMFVLHIYNSSLSGASYFLTYTLFSEERSWSHFSKATVWIPDFPPYPSH